MTDKEIQARIEELKPTEGCLEVKVSADPKLMLGLEDCVRDWFSNPNCVAVVDDTVSGPLLCFDFHMWPKVYEVLKEAGVEILAIW